MLKGVGNRNLNIMFGDFCYFNRHTLHERYTPLGIGLIGQYTKQQFGEDVEVSIYKNIQIIKKYGLDALRAIAMLLGIVLHAALPYVNMDVPDWPSDKSDSEIISIILTVINSGEA